MHYHLQNAEQTQTDVTAQHIYGCLLVFLVCRRESVRELC